MFKTFMNNVNKMMGNVNININKPNNVGYITNGSYNTWAMLFEGVTDNTPNKEFSNYTQLISDWLTSLERNEMLTAKRYFDGFHDILERKRQAIDETGKLAPVHNMANNKLIDNQYKKLVEQKTNFAMGKPITLATSNDNYLEDLTSLFNKKMFKQIRLLGEEAINSGISYLYVFYDKQGDFKVRVFPGYEILPIWDETQEILQEAIRIYQQTLVINGKTEEVVTFEFYRETGITRYVKVDKKIITHPTAPFDTYLNLNGQPYNWNKLPIIPFRYNARQIPLIRGVKSLQDALNEILSDFKNNMDEDMNTTLLVLKNYDGTNLAEFRRNLATYKAVKIHTVDGVQGGVEALKVEVNANNYQAILMQLKRAIIENGRGFDAKEERMDGDPNQMNIESMYTDIDLDVNQMESEFQASFEDLKWFVDNHFKLQKGVDYSNDKVEFIFNRDIFINEDAIIDNCVKSVGLLSNKTVISKHPWVGDLNHELKQIEEDKQQELEEMETLSKDKINNVELDGGIE